MAIILRLDRVMADRKISLNELSNRVEISTVNLSNLKTGKVKAIRFSTLDAICEVLDCQPGDILEFQKRTEEEADKQDIDDTGKRD
ncbi:MAG: helix-turn-helix transcriptional regulator [Sellimonas sp.]|uniref:helix-turn-helix domain-containing protein n=1 Tax=Drancourtella sp. An57 TaxID=1965647 RepID=UPI000B378DE4|nr:helix-turn-helix transcriptional regulator [Drancourtella sp. An57]MEE0780664.1 helix-turn-helix transcriptional regulator [Sellimonas sp.]OUN70208.1 transcriptional regulator [Drancourtella sp. An57]